MRPISTVSPWPLPQFAEGQVTPNRPKFRPAIDTLMPFAALDTMIGVVFGSLELFDTVGRIGAVWEVGAKQALFGQNRKICFKTGRFVSRLFMRSTTRPPCRLRIRPKLSLQLQPLLVRP
jgi:hypothetical protein